ncbi:MAG: ATP-dependent DNA helicase, partial [bacterium]|nr:ATP-dependent DNA helicase [bacterium]
MKRELNISVHALVEHSQRSGDLVLEFSGFGRAVDGIRAHQKIQHARPAEYLPEVTVSHKIETELFILKVSGRIDGVYQYPDHHIIDEIKTTGRKLDFFEKNENLLHWGQAKTYAYIYALQNDLDTIDVQLTYFQLDDAETREYKKTFSKTELESFFNILVDSYLKWAEILENWYSLRDKSIKELKFPFDNYRPGQKRMALDTYWAIKNEDQLIVEAPTGIGKTMAAVFPAIKAMGDGFSEKFFYLTAKTTGRTVAQKALKDLRAGGLKLKSITLTAKDKICFNPDSACNGEECEYAKGFYDRINEAVETIFQQDALTRETIETGAEDFKVCPFELSLELSLWADCVIGDYNYAFDPRVHLRRFFSEDNLNRDYTFLVDEANNLVDRSREMFSAQLMKKSFLEVRRLVKKDFPAMFRILGKINTLMLTLKKECEEAGKPISQKTFPDELTPQLQKFIRVTERQLARNKPIAYRQDLLNLYFEVSWFMKVVELYGSSYTTCLEILRSPGGGRFSRKSDEDFRLKLYCIDPSILLTEAFQRCRAAIFFSATLSPVAYFGRVLGLDPEGKSLILSSPFPQENLCLPVMDRISTLYKYREQTKMALARGINTLVAQQAGNYLIFFPSYKYMKMVYELFLVMNPGVDTIVQSPGMSEEEREEFLDRFSGDNLIEERTLVGFAVMGGIFGEGIDLVGDRLTGAAIVGVGLPGISLERDLIKEYYDNLQGTGFDYAYLYPGMTRVFQAAGRVIRTDTDRGTVLLIGTRFSA